jgi:hypothetical protein
MSCIVIIVVTENISIQAKDMWVDIILAYLKGIQGKKIFPLSRRKRQLPSRDWTSLRA